jgi:hemerythrin-like metal-binding protein
MVAELQETGIPTLDSQHQKIYKMIENLTSSKDWFQYHVLEEDVNVHFATEEALMEIIGYEDFVMHKNQHRALQNRISLRKNRMLMHRSATEEELKEDCEFLIKWLVKHIEEHDAKFVAKLAEFKAKHCPVS